MKVILYSLWSVWLWEEQQYWEPDGSGKRQGASHWPPRKGDLLRRIYWGPADSVSWHRSSVTNPWLALVLGWCHIGCLQTQPFLCSPQTVVCTFETGQAAKSEPLVTWVSPLFITGLFQRALQCSGISLAPQFRRQIKMVHWEVYVNL